jgi:hypothetical protein
MRMVRTSFDRQDTRRERRYQAPIFDVMVGSRRFRSVNWSMSGILLDGPYPDTMIGGHVAGSLKTPSSPQALRFAAELVRTDPETGVSALRFEDIGSDGVDFLDRAIARRLH